MKKIVIFGAGGHARVIADIIAAEGNTVVAFLDDDTAKSNCSGVINDYFKYKDCEFIIGIGDAKVRERINSLDLKWHIAIHPSAIVSPSAIIGEGTVVMPNAVINSKTIIGKHCIINSGSIVEHDNIIEDYSHISVGAKTGGNVIIGKKCWIGIGSTIINNIKIANNVFVGAGSTVTKDIFESGIYFGTPAIKRREME